MLVNPPVRLTRSDTQVVRVLLAEFPAAGLSTVASLARRAGVSDPTVTRLMTRLGFDGFPGFQQALLAELDSRMRSPLSVMEEKRFAPHAKPDAIREYLRSAAACLERSVMTTPAQTYEAAVKLLLEAKGRVLLLGGRFSRHLAGMFGSYLREIRGGVEDLGLLNVTSFDALIGVSRTDVLVVFDYRRYQMDVVRFAEQAALRGAALILFTDSWQSPLARRARATITAETEADSPHDSMVAAQAQIEVVVKRILERGKDAARNRLEALEAVRAANAVALEESPRQGSVRRPRAKPASRHRRPAGTVKVSDTRRRR